MRVVLILLLLTITSSSYAQQDSSVFLDSLVILKEKLKPVFFSDTNELVFDKTLRDKEDFIQF